MITLPSNWNKERLKDVTTVNALALPASTDLDYEFDYIEISNVDYWGIVDRQAIERLRFEDAPSRARRIVSKNCTIVSSVRPNLQAIAFFPDNTEDLICSTGFNVIQPDIARVDPRYLYYVLLSDYAKQYFEAVATGVGYPAVADKDFEAFVLPLPQLQQQERIAVFLENNCSVIDSVAFSDRSENNKTRMQGILNQQMETLVAYRRALIYECVTGQRRIS
ncbi:MAG TPA: restriction endonuclease subunit S [bacterium]|nr:restriction endonuclease subunit S [bacterium]